MHCIYTAKFWIENNIDLFFISNNNFDRFRQVILIPRHGEIDPIDPGVCKKCWMCYNKKKYEGSVQHCGNVVQTTKTGMSRTQPQVLTPCAASFH